MDVDPQSTWTVCWNIKQFSKWTWGHSKKKPVIESVLRSMHLIFILEAPQKVADSSALGKLLVDYLNTVGGTWGGSSQEVGGLGKEAESVIILWNKDHFASCTAGCYDWPSNITLDASVRKAVYVDAKPKGAKKTYRIAAWHAPPVGKDAPRSRAWQVLQNMPNIDVFMGDFNSELTPGPFKYYSGLKGTTLSNPALQLLDWSNVFTNENHDQVFALHDDLIVRVDKYTVPLQSFPVVDVYGVSDHVPIIAVLDLK